MFIESFPLLHDLSLVLICTYGILILLSLGLGWSRVSDK